MQRSSSGILPNIVPSAHRPPRPPTRTRSASMDASGCREDSFLRDLEKGDKRRWKLRADQAVHLIPVVLLACLFVLYVCSSLPIQEHAVGHEQVIRSGLPDRRLQQADPMPEEKPDSTVTQTRFRVTQHDLHRLPLRLRGGILGGQRP